MRRKKLTAYLAGPIDCSIDRGLGWRREFATELDKIGIKSIIPNDIEKQKLLPEKVVELKKDNDLTKFKKLFRKNIILSDLAVMDSCDIIIVRWDGEFIAGTAHECGRAFMNGQPIFLVTPRSFIEVPNWILATATKEFHSLLELVNYLSNFKFKKMNGVGE